MKMANRRLFSLIILTVTLSCHTPQPNIGLVKPPKGRTLSSYQAIGEQAMVSTAHELASQAGIEILKKGGNAVDAATAISFVLSVVQPQHTGMGGGGFALVKMAGEDKVHALDFRERAPQRAFREMYLREGKVNPGLSLNGPLSVAVPGLVAGVLEVQRRYGTGRFSLEELLVPAIQLAENGFPVTPDISEAIERRKEILNQYPASAKLFLPNGRPLRPREFLVQKDLGKTLRQISLQGEAAFYKGEVAETIVRELSQRGGILTLQDLTQYRVKEHPPLSGTYRGYRLFSMPPPSSGGTHLIQILNILEGYDLHSYGPQSAETIHLLAEACRRAYADRSVFLGDPEFTSVPVKRLTSKTYAKELRNRISDHATKSAEVQPKSTTHFSVVDSHGNIVSSTQTINYAFGSGLVVPGTGILLNDEMDDFSAQPGVPNAYGLVGSEANSIQPRKTPLSSMSPTIVLGPDGRFFLAVGAAGGSRIITAVLQTMINLIDFEFPPLEAVAAARTHHQWLPDEIQFERKALDREAHRDLKMRGHQLKEGEGLGRVHAVFQWKEKLVGIADPRGEGKPAGY